MSATLPRARRRELIEAWGLASEEIQDLDYPRLFVADDTGVKGESFAARPLAPIHVSGLGEGLDLIEGRALELLAAGGCGAIIVNTVDRAQRLYGSLREKMGEDIQLLLFHARFPADDRAERERQVLNLFGPNGTRPKCALLIATQVVEQSLDIDFDFMISDLAPVDLLLQRAGRLHRHLRLRAPTHSEPRIWIAGLQRERPPELKETAWGFVYDAYILGRTWALLVREETLHLPADIDRLVQAVYDIDTPLPDDLEDEARSFIEIESYGAYRARVNKERQESVSITIDPLQEPQSAYSGKPRGSEEGEGQGLENRTRLGPESIVLVPVEVVDNEWRVREGEPTFSPDRPVDDATARKLYSRQLKVSRAGIVRHFNASHVPEAFAGHSLLKYFYPLPMRHRQYEIAGLYLRLDDEMGLVYQSLAEVDKESK
jgi:CRISPR-associated endonuclease/helicase Cas3